MECYQCGRPLVRGEGMRRKVQTGERRSSSRQAFALFPSRHSTSRQFALRTVCPECAEKIDAEGSWQSVFTGFKVGLYVLGALLLLPVLAAIIAIKVQTLDTRPPGREGQVAPQPVPAGAPGGPQRGTTATSPSQARQP